MTSFLATLIPSIMSSVTGLWTAVNKTYLESCQHLISPPILIWFCSSIFNNNNKNCIQFFNCKRTVSQSNHLWSLLHNEHSFATLLFFDHRNHVFIKFICSTNLDLKLCFQIQEIRTIFQLEDKNYLNVVPISTHFIFEFMCRLPGD